MKNTLLTTLFLIIAGLIIWDIFFRSKPIPESDISYQYLTDTVWDSIPYIVPEPYPIYTPSRTVTFYKIDSAVLDSMDLVIKELDILVISLLDTISIYQNYFKQFPSNPKLLAIDLRRDTMSMGLLNITGIPQKDMYPINLSQFNYRWDYVTGLTRHPTLTPPVKERFLIEYFAGGGVDLLYLSPYLSGRAEKDWARIRLYGDVQIGLLKKETSGIKVGIDYKFNGTSRNRIW